MSLQDLSDPAAVRAAIAERRARGRDRSMKSYAVLLVLEGYMNIAYALGRIFVPIVFIWEAILKLINIGRFAKLLADSKVPVPDEIAPYLGGMPKYEALAWALAVLELVCGLMILTGLWSAGARCCWSCSPPARSSCITSGS